MKPLSSDQKFKVVLTFHLKPGAADEELRRSREERSFPNLLARQTGCEGIELVKVSDDQTLSIQTWSSQQAWWTALEAVKELRANVPSASADEILESREYVGGTLVRTL